MEKAVQSLASLLSAHADRHDSAAKGAISNAHGDAHNPCALRFDGQAWSYRQLHTASTQLAAGLRAHGLRAGERVAYLGYAQPLQIALLFACAQLGAVLVPLNFRLAAAEWAGVLADCKPTLLLHDAHWADAARQLALLSSIQYYEINSVIRPYDDDIGLENLKNTAEDAAELAVLLVYTSGTTGKPKGAVHTQANLLANMRIASAVQGITAQDLVLTVLPLFHVGGLCIQTLPALYAGACVLLHSRFDAAATLRAIAQERPTLSLQVPATLKALTEHTDWLATDVSSLRAVWAGSSVLPPALIDAFTQRGVPVCNVYGSTETGPFSIATPPDKAHLQQMALLGACGWPAPQVELELANAHWEDGATARGAVKPSAANGASEVGEVCLRGPNVAQRYWPDAPAVDARGFFHTGDLARRSQDGSVCIIGRVKDMVISGGENIYPAELEHLIAVHPLVAECAVLGLPDAQWGEVLVAVVVVRSGAADTAALEAALYALLAAQLARYKLPRRWVWVSSLPKTALGKVQKSVLASSLLL
jgi:fatty-acyl-CoA synthase